MSHEDKASIAAYVYRNDGLNNDSLLFMKNFSRFLICLLWISKWQWVLQNLPNKFVYRALFFTVFLKTNVTQGREHWQRGKSFDSKGWGSKTAFFLRECC